MQQQDDKTILAPTDLSNFLSCHHSSKRDLDAACGKVKRPVRYGPVLDALKERGREHEKSYLEHLRGSGLFVVEAIDTGATNISPETNSEKVVSAMQSYADIIYQPTLRDDTWYGRADFLRKVDRPSDLGDWSYEVIDTKLAHETKAGTILQLCVYSHLLEKLQGIRPELMYVVTPGTDYKPIAYRTDDYAAYFRLLKGGIDQFISDPSNTYPEPVTHCDLCPWWAQCEEQRRKDDHLGYVAGINKGQIKSLRQQGIDCLKDLAKAEEIQRPEKGTLDALLRIKEQAKVQLVGRERNEPFYKLKQPINDVHGLALLPEPTAEDIFLDFEGNHFAEHGVQEYLTGYISCDSGGQITYTPFWARTLEEEKQAFELFMDVAIETRRRNPLAHIYHFAPYETAALKRLMGRFATREVELDELLRGGTFVDLHTVVKRSLVASVERYSIKDLEPFFGYTRRQDLHEASMSRRLVEYAMEMKYFDKTLDEHYQIVEDYNREDCESTQRLRDWLEKLRADCISQGNNLPRPIPQDGEATEAINDLDRELQRLRDGLLDGVPTDVEERSVEEDARFILAHMMEFHRREEKAAWWEYFRILELEESEYADERRAVSGLQFFEELAAGRAPLHRYQYDPGQELDIRRGDEALDADGNKFGKIAEVNYPECTVDVKKRMDTAAVHSSALLLYNNISSKVLRESLMRLGESVLETGFTGQEAYKAAFELLLRRPSPLVGENDSLQRDEEETVVAACRLVAQLDGHVLAIQGPPGTGKTYTGGKIICALRQKGLKVGVTAVSHKVIVNLLESAKKEAEKIGLDLSVVHKQAGAYEGEWDIRRISTYPPIRNGLANGDIDVVGATAWCWSRSDFEQIVDVLIVDEAGQMSLSNVLAVAPAARSLVLLGDPQQLEQPIQASHPEGSEVSALYHLLDGAETIPPNKGLFLGETYRLHPAIAQFTSEVYYQGRLESRPGLDLQSIQHPKEMYSGSGLRYVPVYHEGNQARSDEEVEVISTIINELLNGGKWQDKEQKLHRLKEDDIRIIAPYNAQVSALTGAIPQMKDHIGTVDRFQGQEAPVVIYSMTSSSAEDAPRGMSFLYDPHRFNVATSRASALCILIGSPALFEPECRTPQQMKLANGFCRFRELAQQIDY